MSPMSQEDRERLRESLEAISGNAYLWQQGEGPWKNAEAVVGYMREEINMLLRDLAEGKAESTEACGCMEGWAHPGWPGCPVHGKSGPPPEPKDTLPERICDYCLKRKPGVRDFRDGESFCADCIDATEREGAEVGRCAGCGRFIKEGVICQDCGQREDEERCPNA